MFIYIGNLFFSYEVARGVEILSEFSVFIMSMLNVFLLCVIIYKLRITFHTD